MWQYLWLNKHRNYSATHTLIFRMWSIELDLQQEKTLKDTYFETAWTKNTAGMNSDVPYLPLNKGYDFLMDL